MLVVGIDSGKDRVDAVAMFSRKLVDHHTIDLKPRNSRHKPLDRGVSLAGMRVSVLDWLTDLTSRSGHEATLYIEEPIVYTRALRTAIQLAETVGMLLSLPYPSYLVPIDSWKQIAVGKGGVSKELVAASISSRYPETPALYGGRQDLFDATGVALYGSALQPSRDRTVFTF